MGESFADYINETLGFGLTKTSLLFSAGLIIALVAQFRLDRYVPGIYWLSVVLISVVGTIPLVRNLLSKPDAICVNGFWQGRCCWFRDGAFRLCSVPLSMDGR